ncbi:ribonuclease HII [Haloarcula hispanica N601]|uniref:Ribonuclease HII n=3 Tax=Haloarcula hispanica TaxID=51589 RepID=V5TK75_HALHI|nr:ribonuclease HII [Haloarcula hispanica]AEM56096.1 RNAase HII [Haloarcula hispanica ATCC 33960]AHB64909.1 ribonuclease HII [Haloarcula hispanica N601]MCJ0620830.1 ribonuclease HII [Haloarcula hispanica]RYJ11190.1 ribonuclease HII [Haloarcula hispanica]
MRFGVDEAGKGPVLGSMFAAAVRADPAALPDGVGDSKDIRPERRERLAGDIRESADAVGVAEIPVERIDADRTDMNTLTVDGQAEALSAVARDGLSGTVDAGDTDAARFGRRVADAVDTDVAVTAEHGADETDPLVGAASIVAKVARDAHVADLAEEYGDVGSGYPSDPTTRAFLADYVDRHGELPACARRSWSTCDDVLAAAEQASLGDF